MLLRTIKLVPWFIGGDFKVVTRCFQQLPVIPLLVIGRPPFNRAVR